MVDRWTIFSHIVASTLWIVLGVVLGVASFFLIGQIPAVILGCTLGVCGAVVHPLLHILKVERRWWFVAFGISLLCLFITMVVTQQLRELVIAGVLFVYYFTFGSIIYACAEWSAYK